MPDIDQDTGDAIQRPATPADHFSAPFPNEAAARGSNGGALPPDLSVIAKAREDGRPTSTPCSAAIPSAPGPDRARRQILQPLLPGRPGSFWSGPKDQVPRAAFIAMPFQLTDGRVTFDDGTKSTTEQEAHDVATFLAWAGDPKQEERKQTGLAVMIYLLVLAGRGLRLLPRHLAQRGALRCGRPEDRGGPRGRPFQCGADLPRHRLAPAR